MINHFDSACKAVVLYCATISFASLFRSFPFSFFLSFFFFYSYFSSFSIDAYKKILLFLLYEHPFSFLIVRASERVSVPHTRTRIEHFFLFSSVHSRVCLAHKNIVQVSRFVWMYVCVCMPQTPDTIQIDSICPHVSCFPSRCIFKQRLSCSTNESLKRTDGKSLSSSIFSPRKSMSDDNDNNSVSTSQMSSIPLTGVGNECD